MSKIRHVWNGFRQYQQGDLECVWSCIRSEDLRELGGAGLDPETLEVAILRTNPKIAVWDTEQGPVAILGVTPTDNPMVGLVWAVASDLARPRWRFAVRETEGALRGLAGDYPVLANFKDARNTQQISWLKKVGFTFIAKHEGENGQTYLEFVRIMK